MSTPVKQKALLLTKKFGPYEVGEALKYTPGPGELLIKIKAAALNPADWKIEKSGRIIETFPGIVGLDKAGDVEEVGEGVTEFKKGDRVFSQSKFIQNEFSGFQQYALAYAVTTSKIPSNISYDEAATLPVALGTGYSGLFAEKPHGASLSPPITPETEGKYAGTPIVVLGGSSSVGQAAIQFAKLAGLSPIITTASLKNTSFLTALGATHVLDRSLGTEEISAHVKEITGGKQVEVVFDAIAVDSTRALGLVLAKGGTLVTSPMHNISDEAAKEAGVTLSVVIASLELPWNDALLKTLWHDKLEGWLAKGVIKPNRFEVLPNGLAGIVGGLERMANNDLSFLKLVVHPEETP